MKSNSKTFTINHIIHKFASVLSAKKTFSVDPDISVGLVNVSLSNPV